MKRTTSQTRARPAGEPVEPIHLSRFDTALGPVTLASTARGIVASSLPECADGGTRDGDSRDSVRRWLDRHMPDAEIREGIGRNAPAIAAVRDYLAGRRHELDLPLDLRGTAFQQRVWATLRRVPFGETISYSELARRAGHPRAARACGSANGSNPVPLFVPCHRVIAADGTLGGFGGGLPLKARLLELELRGAAKGRDAARGRTRMRARTAAFTRTARG
jgi:methylated-DNA-[protein]-cysteine S-methyltransferase